MNELPNEDFVIGKLIKIAATAVDTTMGDAASLPLCK